MKVTTALLAATLTVFAVECGGGEAGEMDTMEDEPGMMEEGMDTASASGMMKEGEMGEGGMMEDSMDQGMPEEMMPDTTDETSGSGGMSGGG